MELLEACADGDLSAVSALLQGGAAADAVSSDPQTTPLLEAVKNATGTAEHTAIVKLLLKASADPDRVPVSGPTGEPPGDSALQHASAEGFLVPALRTIRLDFVHAHPRWVDRELRGQRRAERCS